MKELIVDTVKSIIKYFLIFFAFLFLCVAFFDTTKEICKQIIKKEMPKHLLCDKGAE